MKRPLLSLTIVATSLLPLAARAQIPDFVLPGLVVTYSGTVGQTPDFDPSQGKFFYSQQTPSTQKITVTAVTPNSDGVGTTTVSGMTELTNYLTTNGQVCSAQQPQNCASSSTPGSKTVTWDCHVNPNTQPNSLCVIHSTQLGVIAQFWVNTTNSIASIGTPEGHSYIPYTGPNPTGVSPPPPPTAMTCPDTIGNVTCIVYDKSDSSGDWRNLIPPLGRSSPRSICGECLLLAFDRAGLIKYSSQFLDGSATLSGDIGELVYTLTSIISTTASWRGWVKLDNGYATEGLAVASWAANRRDLFTISLDHALWHKSWDGNSWSGWDSLGGGPFMGQPAAVSWDQNRLDIFAVGSTDQQLWHRYFDKGWGTWEKLGGVLKLGVAAASWGPGQLTVYSVGVDNSIYSKSFGANGWSGFQKLNSFCISPTAATAYENELTLGCIGGGNNLYFNNYNSGYQGWVDAGGIGLDVATVSWGLPQFAFFVRGPDFKVYLKTYDNDSSSDWMDLDGVVAYPLAAIAPGPVWMEVYAIGPDHGIYQRVYK